MARIVRFITCGKCKARISAGAYNCPSCFTRP